jgi:hypothetical protein
MSKKPKQCCDIMSENNEHKKLSISPMSVKKWSYVLFKYTKLNITYKMKNSSEENVGKKNENWWNIYSKCGIV